MPLTTPPIAPFILGDIADGGANAATFSTNAVYLYAHALIAPVVVTNMRCIFGSGGAGHYDLGIYDATGSNQGPGSLLGHCASTSTSLATATGVQSPALLSNLALAPGRYWLAMWISNGTDTIYKMSIIGTDMLVSQQGTNSGPLPASAASISSLANTNRKMAIFGLLQGGWS